MSNYMVFVSIRRLRVFEGFDFVIELVGFDSPLIHLNFRDLSSFVSLAEAYYVDYESLFSCSS